MIKEKTSLKGKLPSRRKFFKAAAATGVAAVAASSLAAPAVAADRVEISMVATWPRDFPGLGTGAQRFAKRLSDMSDGRIQVTYYASGERVKALTHLMKLHQVTLRCTMLQTTIGLKNTQLLDILLQFHLVSLTQK